MAAVVQGWSSSNFFPPQSAEVEVPEVSTEPGVAHRLWGLNLTPTASTPYLNAQIDDHILIAAKTIVQGGIIAAVSNNHYVFLADADNKEALQQLDRCSGKPSDVEGAAKLVCAPEWLSEHVDLEEMKKRYGYANLLRFSQDVTSSGTDMLGLILPAGTESGAPAHLLHNGSITSVWKEYQPIRDLSTYVRYFGRRSIMAVSARAIGIDETSDLDMLREKLKGTVTWVLHDPLNQLAYSEAILVDFTAVKPEVRATGNLSQSDLQDHLSRWGLGESQTNLIT